MCLPDGQAGTSFYSIIIQQNLSVLISKKVLDIFLQLLCRTGRELHHMSADQDGSVGKDGGWAATEGPQGFYWGGTWITAATGTDNPTLVADIMRTMTTNVDVMKEIVTADNDFINNKPAMEEMAADESYGDAVLGGQNPLAMFCAGADKIDLSNMSIYDQGCNEEFQNAMKNYFEGNATYDEALDLFYKAVVEKYPELSY